MEKYGLIGRNISYSFSKKYFNTKFTSERIDATYENFDITEISHFSEIKKTENLKGLNVTIPYKEQILPFLDSADEHAEKIGAVNTVKLEKNGNWRGYNTDYLGFKKSIMPFLLPQHKKALILGTGGASKAVEYALKQLQIPSSFVSRKENDHFFEYKKLNKAIVHEHQIIINCTPLGTSPNTETYPPFPIELITANHLVYDLVYNPPETKFMSLAKARGAQVCNGYEMLRIQAEEAWKIWNY